MGRRPGRKRNGKVTKIALVDPKASPPTQDRTAYYEGVEIRDRIVDNRSVTLKERLTALEVVCNLEPDEIRRKRLVFAAEEISKLWALCRQYATDAPSINVKPRNFSGGAPGHEDMNDVVLSFGEKVHERYQGIISAMSPERDREGRAIVSSVIAVCIQNEMATWPGLAKKGLELAADYIGY